MQHLQYSLVERQTLFCALFAHVGEAHEPICDSIQKECHLGRTHQVSLPSAACYSRLEAPSGRLTVQCRL
jgi:hypothetical protein